MQSNHLHFQWILRRKSLDILVSELANNLLFILLQTFDNDALLLAKIRLSSYSLPFRIRLWIF